MRQDGLFITYYYNNSNLKAFVVLLINILSIVSFQVFDITMTSSIYGFLLSKSPLFFAKKYSCLDCYVSVGSKGEWDSASCAQLAVVISYFSEDIIFKSI